jgi:hypothetical protein
VIVGRIGSDDPEAESIAALVDGTFSYYGGPYWKWKYADPSGPPSVIVAAKKDGEVVGCNHGLAVSYRLGSRGTTECLIVGDLVVDESVRRQGVATTMSFETRKIASEVHPNAAVIAMYTGVLGQPYGKLFGYANVTPGFSRWSKRLTWQREIERLSLANEDLVVRFPRLAEVEHVVRFEFSGSPVLRLRVDAEGFQPSDGEPISSFVVKGRSGQLLPTGRLRWFRLLAALLTGRLRIYGSPRAIRQCLSVLGAYLSAIRVLRGG